MYAIFQTYLQLSKKYYKAEPQKVNFKTAPEQSRKEINTWVEKQTESKLSSTPTSFLFPLFPSGPCSHSCDCGIRSCLLVWAVDGCLLPAACLETVAFFQAGANCCQLARRTGQQTANRLTGLCQGSNPGSRALRLALFH